MRKHRSLFPKTRQAILAVMLPEPQQSWYLSDLARRLHLMPSTLQRELATLCEAGVLKRRRDGNRVYFQPDADCPFIPELRGLIMKTAGLADVIREMLEPFAERIESAFVYGSIAREQQQASSDVDLMVLGKISLRELAPAMKRAERALGRPVNPVIYSADEWLKRRRNRNPFVLQVAKEKKIFIIGTSNELAAMAG